MGSAAALGIGGLIALGPATSSSAAFDPSCAPVAPAIQTLTISPTKVNVKTGKRTIIFTGTTTGTPLTGVFVGGEPIAKGPGRYVFSSRVRANSFTVKMVVPKGAANGKHRVSLSLDTADHHVSYSSRRLADRGLPNTFRVVSKPDTKHPKISKIAFDKKAVDTRNKAKKVTVTAKVSDTGGSGVASAAVEISNGVATTRAMLRKKGSRWVGTATFPKWAGTKRATVEAAWVTDRAGNTRVYGGEAGESRLTKALKPRLKVTSKIDTKKPTVSSVTATPSSIELAEPMRRHQVTYRVKAADAQTGVTSVQTRLVQRGVDDPYSTAWGFPTLRNGVWTGTGTTDCDMPGGDYDVEVVVYDRVGNTTLVRSGIVTFTDSRPVV